MFDIPGGGSPKCQSGQDNAGPTIKIGESLKLVSLVKLRSLKAIIGTYCKHKVSLQCGKRLGEL